LTASSENANYPVENIYSPRLSKYFKTTGDTSENIVFDAGAGNTLQANTFTISGHNFTASATLKIQANASDAWGSPTLDESITYGAETIVTFFTLTDLRYWRFTMADAANPDTILKIGNVKLDEYLQITKGPARGLTEKIIDTTQEFYSGGGQHYATQGSRYRTYDLSFKYWENDMRESIRTMLASVQKNTPVVIIIDEDNTDKMYPCYCVIRGDFPVTELAPYTWTSRLQFREVK